MEIRIIIMEHAIYIYLKLVVKYFVFKILDFYYNSQN